MTDNAELELTIHRRDADSYGVELRFSRPGDAADVRLSRPGPAVTEIAPEALAPFELEPEEYGRVLGEQLLADAQVLAAVKQAQTAAATLDASLRIRLFISPSAPELHGLRWELLQVPGAEGTLSTSENTLFSRYLSSTDWRPVRLRPEGELSALVVVADPPGLEEFGLAKVMVEDELTRARAGLGGAIRRTELSTASEITLNHLVDQLRDGVDILYIIAHGLLVDGAPVLFLAGDDGTAATVPGAELVTRLQELRDRPRLVVLASCQSAGEGDVWSTTDNGVLAGLGPRLAEIGIPAVVAMQGNIQMETMAQFVPIFFEELRRDGQVDRAMAAARGAIRGRSDWWAPTLFMRLRNGRIWYAAGFGEAGQLEQWTSLLAHIKNGKCTPILGPGMTESLLGSRRQVARQWAESFHFPMAPHDQDDLPQVTQYVVVNQGEVFAQDRLSDYLREQLKKRLNGDGTDHVALSELFSRAWQLQRTANPLEPNWIMAQLPLPLYITTDHTNMLLDALREAGKQPRVELCRWNDYLEDLPSIQDDKSYYPSAEEPLIFHLFGNIEEPDSLVLTEDNYFDFLIGVTRNKDLIPEMVRRFLVDSALLFLGFGIEEWDFRVLFRSIIQREGRRRRNRFKHVAAQVNPEEGRILEPDRARAYLESYFDDSDIKIYWGSVDDFIRELDSRSEKA